MLQILKKQEESYMKVCGQELEVTLLIHERERTFSKRELIAILEKHFSNETTDPVTTLAKLPKMITEANWFEVNPQDIDKSLFKKKKRDKNQEETRKLILKAFAKVKSNPEKYGKKFKTMTPKRDVASITLEELDYWACQLGDHTADWVEQALEWAQRISNGESWEAICNNADTADNRRMIIWKSGYYRLVGNTRFSYVNISASYVCSTDYYAYNRVGDAVPLVVRYEK